MTHWTQSAHDLLNEHLATYRRSLAGGGLDPDEVVSDLRRHVEEELAAARMQTVTADDLRRVLNRLAPAAPSPAPDLTSVPDAVPALPDAPKPSPRSRTLGFSLFFGVMLPLITLGIELVTHMCAGVFFDPIPTWWHVLLVATVPVANLFLWRLARRPESAPSTKLLLLGGFAVAISSAYSLLYFPLFPAAVFAVMFLGWGLLPLSPLLSLIVAIRLITLLARRPDRPALRLGQRLLAGAGAGIMALVLTTTPSWLTVNWISDAAQTESPERARFALKWLRRIGDERTLLEQCYQTTRGVRGELGFTWPQVSQDDARRVYYLVTGRTFNSQPPPQARYHAARWGFLDDWQWDEAHGGSAVSGRIKGLSLRQSRLDGFADPDGGWAYFEWILEFGNTGRLDREARAQILLPPDAVVSRLTLWVNGQEQEAAFAGVAETRKAYQEVAVVQRRDPVLVTSAGKDRVLMQCFPVPRNGGTIKVRLGITAPWTLLSADQAALTLPRFVERNFGISEDTQHAVWIEGPRALRSGEPQLMDDRSKPDTFALRGEVAEAALSSGAVTLFAARDGAKKRFVAEDHRKLDGSAVLQELVVASVPRPDRVVLVLDTSAGMKPVLKEVADALLKLPEGVETAVVLAQDGVEIFAPLQRRDASGLKQLAAAIRGVRSTGGQDNQRALLQGWQWAAAARSGVVLWIHGPQPLRFEQQEKMSQQMLWRSAGGARIVDLQALSGPNRIAEEPGVGPILDAPLRLGTLSADLERMVKSWQPGATRASFNRRALAAGESAAAPAAAKTSSHVVRLWAHGEILRLASMRFTAEAVKQAALYQLVTPVSGAVVLETKAQFERAGLEPVSADSVPTVPEPGVMALVAFALLLCGVRAAWRRRSRS